MADYNRLNLKGFEIPLLSSDDTTTYPRLTFKKDDKIYNASINVADNITEIDKNSVVIKIKDKIFYGKKKSAAVYSVVLPADCSEYMENYYQSTYTTMTEVPDEMKTPDGSKVTNMQGMFGNCINLKEIPFFDTSNVTNMQWTFQCNTSLTTFPNLDTSNVISMDGMFKYANNMTAEIPLLNTSKVIYMKDMFCNCYNLKSIPQFDTSNVTNMECMVGGCKSLSKFPKLNTSKVTNMKSMFSGCNSLIDIPQLDTSKAVDISSMFRSCTSLPETFPWTIDCSSITSISGIQNIFNSSSVKEVTFKNVKEDLKASFTAANLGSQLTSIKFEEDAASSDTYPTDAEWTVDVTTTASSADFDLKSLLTTAQRADITDESAAGPNLDGANRTIGVYFVGGNNKTMPTPYCMKWADNGSDKDGNLIAAVKAAGFDNGVDGADSVYFLDCDAVLHVHTGYYPLTFRIAKLKTAISNTY